MIEDWIIQIDFPVQNQYELNKGFIKSIIKDRFKLKKWDNLNQRWWDGLNDSVEVKRLVKNEKTVGLKVRGNTDLADSLWKYCKGIGAQAQWLSTMNAIDKEVEEIVMCESTKYGAFIDARVERGEVTKEEGEKHKKNWENTVRACEYEKRGVEY